METACPQAVFRFICRFNGVRARHLQRRDLLPFTGGSQSAVEKFGSGAVDADPIAPAEQVVNFVGDPGSHGNADVLNEICSIGSTLNHNFQGSGKDDACKIITVAVGGV